MSDPKSEADGKQCRFLAKCPMFPLFTSKSILRIYQIRYCEGTYTDCARYKKASQGVMPPANLLPDGDVLPDDAK